MSLARPLAFACLLGALGAGGAAAQEAGPVSAGDPASVAAAIRTLGFGAAMSEDSYGDPMIESAAEGVDFRVLFYGCEAQADCKVIQFRAGFDLPEGTTLEEINAWNAGRLFGKAFLDDEMDPFVEMAVEMSRPMDFESFAETYAWWRTVLVDFQRHIGW